MLVINHRTRVATTPEKTPSRGVRNKQHYCHVQQGTLLWGHWPRAHPLSVPPQGSAQNQPFIWSGVNSLEGGKATWDLLFLSATILGMATGCPAGCGRNRTASDPVGRRSKPARSVWGWPQPTRGRPWGCGDTCRTWCAQGAPRSCPLLLRDDEVRIAPGAGGRGCGPCTGARAGRGTLSPQFGLPSGVQRPSSQGHASRKRQGWRKFTVLPRGH